MLNKILENSPQLSKLQVDHCVYAPSKASEVPAEPQRDLPKISLNITELELDLLGVNGVLESLFNPPSVNYTFGKPIEMLTLTNHLYRLPSPASSYSPALWKRTKVDYSSWKVKRILSKMHGVERLYLRTGGPVIPDPEVPFTFHFQTENLAPLKDVEELVFQCGAGDPDEVCVTLKGLEQEPTLFPLLRKIRLERCKTMAQLWEPLVETVRVREQIATVELVECEAAPGACLQLDDLLAGRRAHSRGSSDKEL
jgi:hypothetical protein